jgi:hypothetical protein
MKAGDAVAATTPCRVIDSDTAMASAHTTNLIIISDGSGASSSHLFFGGTLDPAETMLILCEGDVACRATMYVDDEHFSAAIVYDQRTMSTVADLIGVLPSYTQ